MAQNDSVFTGALPRLYDRLPGEPRFVPYAVDMAQRPGGLTAGRVLETAGRGVSASRAPLASGRLMLPRVREL
jgi:hypothetical protein